jgi:hypothetical protein
LLSLSVRMVGYAGYDDSMATWVTTMVFWLFALWSAEGRDGMFLRIVYVQINCGAIIQKIRLGFSQRQKWEWLSSGLLRLVVYWLLTDVSENLIASMIGWMSDHLVGGDSKLLWNVAQFLSDDTMQHSISQPTLKAGYRYHIRRGSTSIQDMTFLTYCSQLIGPCQLPFPYK